MRNRHCLQIPLVVLMFVVHIQHWEKQLSECLSFHLITWTRNLGIILDSSLLLNSQHKGLLCPINSISSMCFKSAPFSPFPLLPALFYPRSSQPNLSSCIALVSINSLSPMPWGWSFQRQILYCYCPSQKFSVTFYSKGKFLTWHMNSFMIRPWNMHSTFSLCQSLISTHIPNTLSHL